MAFGFPIFRLIGLIPNEKFADFPASELPAMYLEEYQELTTKLHELELKEQLLSEKLQQKNDTPDHTDQTDQTTEVSTDRIKTPNSN